jgi:hypothetical protein
MGLLFLILAWFMGGRFVGHSEPATGTVVAVSSQGSATIEFALDGGTYRFESGENGVFRVGDQVSVRYDAGDPAWAETRSMRITSVVFALVGAASLVAGVVMTALLLVRRRAVRRIIDRGEVVMASIVGTRANMSAHLGRKNPWYITCEWADRATARDHTFTSQAIWSQTDPAPTLTEAKLTTLPVYIDENDPGRHYFVDDRAVLALLDAGAS